MIGQLMKLLSQAESFINQKLNGFKPPAKKKCISYGLVIHTSELYEARHYNNPTYIRTLLHQISLNISEASYAHNILVK
jgi:hypothetical protein